MPSWDVKSEFALLCLLGVITIGTGALLEINRLRRDESLITVNQFRLRMISAVVWIISLGSLGYSLLYLWPERGDLEQARRFLSVVSGVLLLLIIGLILLVYDFWRVTLDRRIQQKRFNRQLEDLAREEIEKQQREAQQRAEREQ